MIRLALALLLFCALPARAEEIVLHQDGFERHFELIVPDGLEGPAPLVLMIHGVLETDGGMQRVSRGRLDALAARYGFVVAYPSAILGVWDMGEGPGAAALRPRRDDLGYLRRVIAETEARAPIDRSRIFAAGFSQGGVMSYALACKYPGLLRAIASISMPLPGFLLDDCAAHPPGGVMLLHGTQDRVVPFEGGPMISGPNGALMQLLSHTETVTFFARHLGCEGAPVAQLYDAKNDGTRVIREIHDKCAQGLVEDYVVEGGGHVWPDGKSFLGRFETPTQEIDGAAAVWSFFSRFR